MSLAQQVEGYLAAAYARGLGELSLKNQRSHLHRFLAYLEERGVTEVAELGREQIEDYLEELSWSLTSRGRPMKPETRNVRLWSIKSFCRWMLESDLVALDPASRVEYGRKSQPLPRGILSVEQMQCLLSAPDPRRALGVRDRVVLELLYSTAVRVAELCGFDLGDVDLEGGLARVRQGKGSRDRMVPVGKLACELLQSYLQGVRPQLVAGRGKEGEREQALIVSSYGERLGPRGVAKMISKYARAVGLDERITPHTFRHCCATHMLRAGANLRHLQEMLGHRQLASTQVYTRVTITELKEVHAKFHPRAGLEDAQVRSPKAR